MPRSFTPRMTTHRCILGAIFIACLFISLPSLAWLPGSMSAGEAIAVSPSPATTVADPANTPQDSRRQFSAFFVGIIILQAFIIAGLIAGLMTWRRHQQDKVHQAFLLGNVISAAEDFAIISVDTRARITLFSKGAEKMLGYKASEVKGKHPEYFHLASEVKARLAQFNEGRATPLTSVELFVESARLHGSETREWVYVHKDGHSFPVTIVVTPILDNQHRITGYLGIARDISKEKAAELALRKSKEQYRSVISAMSEGVVMQDKSGHFIATNKAAEDILGLSDEQLKARSAHDDWHTIDENGQPFPTHLHPTNQTLASGKPMHNVLMGVPQPDGQMRWLSINTEPVFEAGDKVPQAVVATFVDITERKAIDDKLRLSAQVFANSYEGIMITSAENRIIEVNPAFTRITGYSAEEVLGKKPSLLSSGRQDDDFYKNMWQDLHEQGVWHGEIWNRRKSGEIYAELLALSTIKDNQGQVINYIGVFSDINQLKAHERELDLIAHYDPLTGLPNRRLLNDLLDRQLAYTRRRQQGFAVVFIDLDGFKPVNDQFGHQAGDELLVSIAQRLKLALRDCDVVARLGGDEFVVLLSEINAISDITQSLSRIQSVINEPVAVASGNVVSVSASIGVTSYPEDGADPEILLRHADQAMYKAKQAGKNQYHLFDAERDRQVQGFQNWLSQLDSAINNGQLHLYYQPRVDLLTGKVEGCEALLRWQHPIEGLKVPGDFLPQLLNTELAVKLGNWVLRSALAQLAQWQAQGLALSLSVNISHNHLLRTDFAETLAATLAEYPEVAPSKLELEIVEATALPELERITTNLAQSRLLGVKTALDDFGTGYASLTYMRSLPLDSIKIDQSVVATMLEDPNNISVIENVIAMAKAFNRQVVAEGVETLQQTRALLQLGCSKVQGYNIAKPMPADALPAWLANWQSRPLSPPNLTAAAIELPLNAAAAAHRRWLEKCLQWLGSSHYNGAEKLPYCGLDKWLQSAGMARYGHLQAFADLAPQLASCHEALKQLQLIKHHSPGPVTAMESQPLQQAGERFLATLNRLHQQWDQESQAS